MMVNMYELVQSVVLNVNLKLSCCEDQTYCSESEKDSYSKTEVGKNQTNNQVLIP